MKLSIRTLTDNVFKSTIFHNSYLTFHTAQGILRKIFCCDSVNKLSPRNDRGANCIICLFKLEIQGTDLSKSHAFIFPCYLKSGFKWHRVHLSWFKGKPHHSANSNKRFRRWGKKSISIKVLLLLSHGMLPCPCPVFSSIAWIMMLHGAVYTDSQLSLQWAQGVDRLMYTVYPKKYTHGFVVLCFVVVTQSFIMNSHEVFIHIHQGCFAGTGAIVRLPQCQWSKPDGYGKISQCITTTKHSKAKTVCIFLGVYCT